jgi:hypothetical protein
MDGLSAQLNDMASEMVDSRSKVSLYAKKLGKIKRETPYNSPFNPFFS